VEVKSAKKDLLNFAQVNNHTLIDRPNTVMVETENDHKDVNKSDVKAEAEKQNNGVSSSIQPAIITTVTTSTAITGAIVPLRTGDKSLIEREENYRPLDPEHGDALAHHFHQSPPPYSNDGPTRADFETAIELTGYGKFHCKLILHF
jgi:hypothetical protein